ncbi:MAG: ribosome silencing factor [Chloroflexi bacterium]|nr:ribosome silencing factor [Chloroflexota bacterium]
MAQPLPEEETTESLTGQDFTAPRVVAREPEPLALAKDIVQIASDRGASDILLMDIRKLSIIADYFAICSGENERQIRAIHRGIRDGVDERYGLAPMHRAGPEQDQGGWVVLDYGGVIVHIFSPQMREYYHLERLWSEAATLLRMQ